MGQPQNAIYCASKRAIEGWAEAVLYELEPFAMRMRRAWRGIRRKWLSLLPKHLRLGVLGFGIPSGLSHASIIF